jgi:hypothetical protein
MTVPPRAGGARMMGRGRNPYCWARSVSPASLVASAAWCALKGIEVIQERLDFAIYLVLCGPVPADPFPGRGAVFSWLIAPG